MAAGQVNAVVVGADRIAANGDIANKIGTYGVAILAHAHGIPFYVAAPLVDHRPGDADRRGDPDRGAQRRARSRTWAARSWCRRARRCATRPSTSRPHRYVTAIVTERGVVHPPFADGLAALA